VLNARIVHLIRCRTWWDYGYQTTAMANRIVIAETA
jgi:asparagine N-glycosylation enzyme membrane subunit Stt3